jgi:acetyl-CoA carboxylase biotin carboxyl carrier protein
MSPVTRDDIQWLIALAQSEGLAELEVSGSDWGVLVRRARAAPQGAACGAYYAPAVPSAAARTRTDLVPIAAPMAGIFYRSSAPDSPPFVEEGDEVQQGETVALIEAMKLYNDVEAPCAGRIERILAADASRVAADQDLILIKPSEESEGGEEGA